MIVNVGHGDNFQAALDNAKPGDELAIDPRARFIGNYYLPPKPAGPSITIRSSAPLPERRIGPNDAPLLPTFGSPNADPAIRADHCARWVLRGLRFEPNPAGLFDVIHCQDADDITFDRLLLVVPPGATMKRGILANGTRITLTRSHLAGVNMPGQDSQAFCAWDGAGPFAVVDNFLEAASENVMFGGAGALSPERIPSNILVEGNHFTKPVAWKGQGKGVKNLFELKTAKHVIIRNNVFEHCWADAQSGYAIVFTVRNDNADAPWSTVEDVLFEKNIVRDADRGFNVLGYNDGSPSGQLTRLTIRDNDVQCHLQCMQLGGEAGIVSFEDNRVQNGGFAMNLYSGQIWPNDEAGQRNALWAVETLYHRNNTYTDPTIFGDGVGTGAVAITTFVDNYNPSTPPPEPPEPGPGPEPPEPEPGPEPPALPLVAITSVVRRGKSRTFTVMAEAVDDADIARVEFLAGTTVQAMLTAPPFNATIKLPAGVATITVRATDAGGRTSEDRWSIGAVAGGISDAVLAAIRLANTDHYARVNRLLMGK